MGDTSGFIFNVHLLNSKNKLLNIIAKDIRKILTVYPSTNVVCIGDFNLENPAIAGVELKSPSVFTFFRGETTKSKLDHILASSHVQLKNFQTLAINSDHRAIRATLSNLKAPIKNQLTVFKANRSKQKTKDFNLLEQTDINMWGILTNQQFRKWLGWDKFITMNQAELKETRRISWLEKVRQLDHAVGKELFRQVKMIFKPKDVSAIINTVDIDGIVTPSTSSQIHAQKQLIERNSFLELCPHEPRPNLHQLMDHLSEAVLTSIKNNLLNPNKTCGPDGLHPKVLERLADLNDDPTLTTIIKKQLQKPTIFDTRPVLVQKNVPDDEQAIKVRPIQVGNVFWRLLEKGIKDKVESQIKLSLPQMQHGFTHGKDTHTTWNQFDSSFGQYPKKKFKIIFVDLSSAYNSVDRTKLLNIIKLKNPDAWITQYLEEWFNHATINIIGKLFKPSPRVPKGLRFRPTSSTFTLTTV
jgi:hypothetical protein